MGGLPDFVIIGAMKSATTTLHEQLAAQAGIFMSEPKEPNFFSDEENWAKGMGWYRGLFEGAGDALLTGESSTHYTKLPDYPSALPRIRERLPDAKFIYVMRHPMQRLLLTTLTNGWSVQSIARSTRRCTAAPPLSIMAATQCRSSPIWRPSEGSGFCPSSSKG
jgi:hypothetical protein